MDELIYRLTVIDSTGRAFSCCMSRDEALQALEEFGDHLITDPLYRIHGYTDSADRAEAICLFKRESIVGVYMERLY